HSLAPSTQIQFMNNQSKKCLSEQHWAQAGFFVPCPSTSRQNPPSLRRFYASQIGLYGAFTPVLHTLSASMRPMGSTRICIDP
ncbi:MULTISPECIES: hypothetical protein, partial [unclassified Aeromonas]|uniref:hypothetical protein n=1 Tax=unclassified Aeromonas TaxID=257493 RepID=UPI0022E0337A